MDTKIITYLAILSMSAIASYADDRKPATLVKFDQVFKPTNTRSMTGAKQVAWLVSQRESMPMLRRELGPFGLPQDPTRKVVKTKKKNVAAAAFLNAIKAMNINLVDANDGKFAIGSREFRKGEMFPLIRGGRQFNTKVVRVNSDYIVFKNINSGEHVKKNLNTMPSGMKKNGTFRSVPGVIMESKRGNNALVVDSK